MFKQSVCLMLSIGCGSSGASVDAARSTDTPIVEDASVDATLDAALPTWTSGIVTLSQGSPGNFARAKAVFAEVPVDGTAMGSNGPCVDYRNAPDSGDSAGSIAISGTVAPLVLVPSGSPPLVGYDPQSSPSFPLFVGGATISATASTFSISTTAPETLQGFVSPSTISRASGYTPTWTAGAGPMIAVIVETDTDQLICTVPDNGSYTVASASLA